MRVVTGRRAHIYDGLIPLGVPPTSTKNLSTATSPCRRNGAAQRSGLRSRVGWLVRALPYMIISTIVVLLFTRAYVRPRWRSSVRILAICLIFSLAGLILRPNVHSLLIAVVGDAGLTDQASIVSAGLLPTRVTGASAHFVDLLSGQTGVVAVESTAPGAPFWVNGSPHLEGWWLLLVIGVCALPLVWCLSVGLTPEEEPEEELEEEPTTGRREVEA